MNRSTVRALVICFLLSLHALSANAMQSLDQIWLSVKTNNPSAAASRLAVNVAYGQQMQASAMPNPVVSFQGNVPGFGQYSDNPNADATYIINQLVELGGKRWARRSVADAQYQDSILVSKINNSALYSQTVNVYLSLAESTIKAKLSKKGDRLNQRIFESIEKRFKAGETSKLALHAAQIAANKQRIITSSYQSEETTNKYLLARLQNAADASNIHAIPPRLDGKPLYPLTYYLNQAKNNWEMKEFYQAEKIAKSKLELAEANKYPDANVGIGIQHFNQSSSPKSSNAVIAELSFALPIFDANQGNIYSAIETYKKTLDDTQTKFLTIQSNITNAYQVASQALLQIKMLRKAVIPQSKQLLKLARKGYDQGRYSYLELINAQQKLVEDQIQEITSIFIYLRAWYVLQISIGSLPYEDK